MRIFFVLVCLALTASAQVFPLLNQGTGCPHGGAASPKTDPGPEDFIELERSSCFGTCPAYRVRIYGNGQVTWQGRDSVQTLSAASAQIAPDVAITLIEKSIAAGFWKLCARYERTSEDAPTAYLLSSTLGS